MSQNIKTHRFIGLYIFLIKTQIWYDRHCLQSLNNFNRWKAIWNYANATVNRNVKASMHWFKSLKFKSSTTFGFIYLAIICKEIQFLKTLQLSWGNIDYFFSVFIYSMILWNVFVWQIILVLLVLIQYCSFSYKNNHRNIKHWKLFLLALQNKNLLLKQNIFGKVFF